MKCPVCLAWTTVVETRNKPEGFVRRRRCGNDHTFRTVETVVKIIQKKKDLQVLIENTFPVPLPLYPFHQMKVGDSFALPPDKKQTTVITAATRFGQKSGMKFTIRKMEDGSYRCWRIK